jgi:hypothetical protein
LQQKHCSQRERSNERERDQRAAAADVRRDRRHAEHELGAETPGLEGRLVRAPT